MPELSARVTKKSHHKFPEILRLAFLKSQDCDPVPSGIGFFWDFFPIIFSAAAAPGNLLFFLSLSEN